MSTWTCQKLNPAPRSDKSSGHDEDGTELRDISTKSNPVPKNMKSLGEFLDLAEKPRISLAEKVYGERYPGTSESLVPELATRDQAVHAVVPELATRDQAVHAVVSELDDGGQTVHVEGTLDIETELRKVNKPLLYVSL